MNDVFRMQNSSLLFTQISNAGILDGSECRESFEISYATDRSNPSVWSSKKSASRGIVLPFLPVTFERMFDGFTVSTFIETLFSSARFDVEHPGEVRRRQPELELQCEDGSE
jgi:hypothetical protein